MGGYVLHMCVGRGQKRASDALIVNPLMWVLVTKLGSVRRAASAIYC